MIKKIIKYTLLLAFLSSCVYNTFLMNNVNMENTYAIKDHVHLGENKEEKSEEITKEDLPLDEVNKAN